MQPQHPSTSQNMPHRAATPLWTAGDMWAPDLRRRPLPDGLDSDTLELLRDWRTARGVVD